MSLQCSERRRIRFTLLVFVLIQIIIVLVYFARVHIPAEISCRNCDATRQMRRTPDETKTSATTQWQNRRTSQEQTRNSKLEQYQQREHLNKVEEKSLEQPIKQQTIKTSSKKVLIAAYKRSGSTLTGELFASSAETFYLFEPSTAIYVDWYKASSRLSTSTWDSDAIINSTVIEPYTNMFQCSFHQVPLDMLLNPSFYDYFTYPGSAAFRQCAHDRGVVNAGQVTTCFDSLQTKCPIDYLPLGLVNHCYEGLVRLRSQRHLRFPLPSNRNGTADYGLTPYLNCSSTLLDKIRPCIRELENSCLAARVRVVKEVWMDLRLVLLLLRRDPDLKVIHLVRDPRGILLSRKNLDLLLNGSQSNQTDKLKLLAAQAKKLCLDMGQNLAAFDTIRREFPGAAIQIRYEDLVQQLENVTRSLYRHIGLTSDVAEQYYSAWQRQKSSSTNVTRLLNTYRIKPEAEAYDWLNLLNEQDRRTIEREPLCAKIIQDLGYPDLV